MALICIKPSIFVNKIVLNINLIKFEKAKGKINENQKRSEEEGEEEENQ